MARWIKWPGPGQFRGEGEWNDLDGTFGKHMSEKERDEFWERLNASGYVPFREQEEKPTD